MSTENLHKNNFFSSRLKSLRGSLKKAEFCRILGIPPPMYQRYEAGQVPKERNLRVIADKCNVSVDWLLGREDGAVPRGPVLRMGSVESRELLAYRDVPTDWLEREAASLMENLPTSAKGRGRLSLIRRIMEMLVELQERCVDEWTGEKRKPDGTRNVGPWADVETFKKAMRKTDG